MSLAHMPVATREKLLAARLKTYSPTGRAQGVEYSVVSLSENGITFIKQNGKEQTARREEMDTVSDAWDSLKSRQIARKDLYRKSFNTSYLFGVLYFRDTMG